MNNLGYLTDSFFLEEAREIIEYPDYTFVRSPNQPYYYYGNYLLLNQPPQNRDKEKLEHHFQKHFTDEKIKHLTFCWSGANKAGIPAFIDAGYKLDELSVLTAKNKNLFGLPKKNEEVTIRTFQSNEDWQQWINLECDESHEGFSSEDSFRTFQEGRVGIYQQLQQKEKGHYFGAFIADQLVAAAGLFHQGTIGRFQSVRTKKAFRRRGICKTLMHTICQMGFQKLETLVIAAKKGYHALGLYKDLGFAETDSQTSLYWEKT